MSPMEDISSSLASKYLQDPDLCLRYLEWRALDKFGPSPATAQYPEYSSKWAYWADHFTQHKKDWHAAIYLDLIKNKLSTLEEFYTRVEKNAQPNLTAATKAQNRKALGRKQYQRNTLADDFIENDELIARALQLAQSSVHGKGISSPIPDLVNQVLLQFPKANLSEGQLETLAGLLKRRIEKLAALQTAESSLVNENDKNAWFLWGKIKSRYAIEDTFSLSSREISNLAQCSKNDGSKLLKLLVKSGVISMQSEGKSHQHKRVAGIYKRLL